MTAITPDRPEPAALRRIEAAAARRLISGPTPPVAVIDDGVDTGHDALAASVIDGYDVWRGAGPQAPSPWDAHGTACAGVIAAAPRPGAGVCGVCPGGPLLAVRAFRSSAPGEPWSATPGALVAAGIEWAW